MTKTTTAKTKPTKSWNPMAVVNLLKFRIHRGSMDNRRPTKCEKIGFCVKSQNLYDLKNSNKPKNKNKNKKEDSQNIVNCKYFKINR